MLEISWQCSTSHFCLASHTHTQPSAPQWVFQQDLFKSRSSGFVWWEIQSTCFWTIVWRIWNFDTNEYPNIFVLKKTIRTNVRIYSYQKKDTNMIRTNIRGGKYSNIFEYPNIQHSMIWKIWYERISEYIRIKKMIRTNIRIYSYQKKDTNMIRTNIRGRKYSNIFEYPNIRHTMKRTAEKS